MVVRTLAFVVVRRVLGLVGLGQAPDAKDIEIAVLRHQLMVLRRQVTRPGYTPQDRLMLAMLARLLPRERWAAFLVTPATLLRWHRELVARRWTYPVTGHGSRGLDPQTVELVVWMARENPRWGYIRIVGECRKIDIRLSATSVRRILRRLRLRPAPRRAPGRDHRTPDRRVGRAGRPQPADGPRRADTSTAVSDPRSGRQVR